jgi:hypothetical protein
LDGNDALHQQSGQMRSLKFALFAICGDSCGLQVSMMTSDLEGALGNIIAGAKNLQRLCESCSPPTHTNSSGIDLSCFVEIPTPSNIDIAHNLRALGITNDDLAQSISATFARHAFAMRDEFNKHLLESCLRLSRLSTPEHPAQATQIKLCQTISHSYDRQLQLLRDETLQKSTAWLNAKRLPEASPVRDSHKKSRPFFNHVCIPCYISSYNGFKMIH